ncbi:MAG: hypothetical protein U9R28_10795 [Pseudomonadota bacterium]|nr:hypothetical protein [Pseudomonadota bacterium]
MNRYKTAILTVLTLCFSNVQALEVTNNTELHGFFSQGYVYSPDNDFAGSDSEDGGFNFREIGINGSWNANEQFRVTGQLLSRTMDEVDDGQVRVDFLLADYLAYSGEQSTFGIRLGRVKNELGVYNSTRDIPSARPGVNVPNAIYFDAFRDTMISTDGLNFYGSVFSGVGTLNWSAFTGSTELESKVMENYLFAQDIQGKFDEVGLSGLKLNFSPSRQPSLNFGISLLKLDTNMSDLQTAAQAGYALQTSDPVTDAATYAATPVEYGGLGLVPETDGQFEQYVGQAAQKEASDNYEDYITAVDMEALFAILSVQYAYADWLFSAEYLIIDSDIDLGLLGSLVPIETTTEGYVLQAEWFFKESLTAMLRYEELYLLNDDRDGSKSARDNDPYHGYGKGLTIGLGWDITTDWRLTGQMSTNEGTVWLPSYDGFENEDIKKHWKTYMLQIAYQF